MWVLNQAVKFKSIPDREYVVSSAKTLVTHYLTRNDDYKSQLDNIASGVTEIIKDIASKCFRIKKSRPKGAWVKKKRERWFDSSLTEMKRQVERAAYSLRKHPKDPIVRGRYFTIKKTFKS